VDRLPRRTFLTGSLTAAATAGLATQVSAQPALPQYEPGSVFCPGEIIDTNVYLFRWPFSHSRYEDPETLVKTLRSHGVVQAWAGSYEGLFHKDISGVNQRLVAQCQAHGGGLLIPFGTVNPNLPGWQEDLRRCAEEYRMPGIRVHPGYQNYTLDDPVFAELLRRAAAHRLLVQVVCWMEDERHHNPQMIVPTVDPSPLAALVSDIPGLQVMVLNAFRNPGTAVFDRLVQLERISMDIAMLELIQGLNVFLKQVPLERIVFGSYLPYFYIEANLLKLQESELSAAQSQAIRIDNARRILRAVQTATA
jgi:predicted TIM-barrel fold metal-dependent hydrolase